MISLSLKQLKELIPHYVIEIAETLQKEGYEAYLVGGSVRDVLVGKIPGDYDIATNAYPEDVVRICPRSVPTGAKFGTITVVGEDEKGERFDVEVTTYRSEADYMGGRWPAKVEFTKTIEEDLSRRDFTINAMALNLQEFDTVDNDSEVKGLLKDPYDGIADLEGKLIRAVGDPIDRFSEDGLRPMRGCRLASQLDFEIEPWTFKAMQGTNHITKQVSVERLRDELMKILLKSPKPSKGLRLLKDTGILEIIVPELLEGIGIFQPEYHVDDVFEHSLKAVDAAEDNIKLAALFHDIAKPRTMNVDDNGCTFLWA
jgi:tRNA nucleotidyltransferase/poly(A) polymerase